MIAQQGRVVGLEGDEAVIRIGGTSGCAVCDAGEGCGAGIFGRLLRNRPVTILVPNAIDAQVGQAVRLGIPEERFLALVLRLYAVPILAGLVGAGIGFAVAVRLEIENPGADLWTLACALGAAAVALGWAKRRIGEFPLQTAVHLLHAAEPPRHPECPGSATDDFESLKRL